MNGTTELDDLVRLYQQGDPLAAVEAAIRSLRADDPLNDINYTCGAILIDRGGEINDVAAIEAGIAVFTAYAGECMQPKLRNQARYNLANGYGALAKHHELAGSHDARLIAWKQERDELQAILLDRRNIPSDLLPNILTNFANSLSQLGRKAEALDYYIEAMSIASGHPMALGCAGQVTFDLIGIQPQHNVRLLAEARRYLTLALSNPTVLANIGGSLAEQGFRSTLSRVDQQIGATFPEGVSSLEKYIEGLQHAHEGWEPDGQVSEWIDARLLLTVNPYPKWCPDTVRDDIFFDGLATKTGDDGIQRFTALSHTLNQIKEEFATARYLYTLSRSPDDLSVASKVTHYANTLDYADFGLASGLLKTAIRLSADILDKVANFLNRYLDLGIPAHRVSFTSVWYEKGNAKNSIAHPLLLPQLKQSGWLRGIRDVAETLNLFPAPVKDIRNKATHDFLIIENVVRPQVRLHGKTLDVDAHEFTRQLLVMAKGVVVNMVAFVQRNEAITNRESVGTRLPIPFNLERGISDWLSDASQEKN